MKSLGETLVYLVRTRAKGNQICLSFGAIDALRGYITHDLKLTDEGWRAFADYVKTQSVKL